MGQHTGMASNALKTALPSTDAEPVLAALNSARARTLALVAPLSEAELERVHSPIMSPLVWDLGHIAAYEDLWLAHRQGGIELLRGELAESYDAFETPRAVRGEIRLLGVQDTLAYMRAVHERSAEMLARDGVGDAFVCEMVIRHELQHSETMRQTLAIAGLLDARDRAEIERPLCDGPAPCEAWVEIAAGSFAMGAAAGEQFAYDNERPQHAVELPAFAIARWPVDNASWLRFSEDGGYQRREWWSREGWAWKQEHDVSHDPSVAAGHPRAPVAHVSWFEADAFARAQGARLPSESEWEKAARSSSPGSGTSSSDQRAGSALAGVGRVWEWTQSTFGGYPGFRAHPYREYSEVFFGDAYRVLRGSSWATSPRVVSPSFRNWDLPQRRQIFAGLRLARDLG